MIESAITQTLSRDDKLQLDTLYANLQSEAGQYLGFPWNAKFDYGELFRFLNYPINNDGDPFSESPYHLNTHSFERDVVNTLAELMGAQAGKFWGYVTSGGTEGNLYGVFSARELLPDGIFYCSKETFSLKRLLSSLGVRSEIVQSHDNGCMDVNHLCELLKQNRNSPSIILANIGTTLKGAVDDLPGIHQSIAEAGISDYYIHADAALSGMVLPFVENAPPWNFKGNVDSISISLHKMVGAPIPCGVVLTDQSRRARFSRHNECRGGLESTILASRTAITPLFLWYALRTVGLDGFRQRVKDCLATAEYTIERIQEIGWKAWRHPYSITVVFDKPSDSLVSRWQLFVEGGLAHIMAMPHVTRSQIDRFVDELRIESPNGPHACAGKSEVASV